MAIKQLCKCIQHYRLSKILQGTASFRKKFETDENPMIKTLVETYEHNNSVLHEAMKENFLYDMLASVLLDVPSTGRKADDLINAIKEIKSNTENLEYTLKIYTSS
ncbi:hypothetical protein [Terrimonas alba]|uniref:hypothetical protein n=1 Tax=Terrimonas alba TaxID=3349636 RepID=UPI0035F38810